MAHETSRQASQREREMSGEEGMAHTAGILPSERESLGSQKGEEKQEMGGEKAKAGTRQESRGREKESGYL